MANRWECSPFGTPQSPGVYCVILTNYFTKRKQLLYIGSSKNINKRVMNPKHHYRRLHDFHEFPFMVSVKFKVCDNYIELEKSLIRKLKPVFNLQYSGKEYRSYQLKLS